MKLGVFVPGRLLSERLPNKLILPFGDSCLWDIACRKLNDLSLRFSVYALCRDPELIRIAERYRRVEIVVRGEETVMHDGPLTFIYGDLHGLGESHLMFLNPCLPFLRLETIERCLLEFETFGYEYATSVKQLQNWVFDRSGRNLNPMDYQRLSTKEIPPLYQAANGFHIFNRKQFFADGRMLNQGHGLLEVPEEEAIDIDTPLDFEYAHWRYQRRF